MLTVAWRAGTTSSEAHRAGRAGHPPGGRLVECHEQHGEIAAPIPFWPLRQVGLFHLVALSLQRQQFQPVLAGQLVPLVRPQVPAPRGGEIAPPLRG